jgi:hypothetical protein
VGAAEVLTRREWCDQWVRRSGRADRRDRGATTQSLGAREEVEARYNDDEERKTLMVCAIYARKSTGNRVARKRSQWAAG